MGKKKKGRNNQKSLEKFMKKYKIKKNDEA